MGTALSRVRVTWSGVTVVGPSVSTFYTSVTPAALLSAINSGFGAYVSAVCPAGTAFSWDSSGEVIDSESGEMTGTWSSGSGGGATSTGGTTFAAGVGGRVVWSTAGIVGGRRVKGSTFIVPMHTTAYDGNGSLTSSTVSALQSFATGMFASGTGMCIWSPYRPARAATDTEPARPERLGSFHPVTSGGPVDAVSWLRSRRT